MIDDGTIVNETIVNETIVNETIVNETAVNMVTLDIKVGGRLGRLSQSNQLIYRIQSCCHYDNLLTNLAIEHYTS